MTEGVSGASLTIDELCAASGLSPADVATLQSFGLVESTMVAGIACPVTFAGAAPGYLGLD